MHIGKKIILSFLCALTIFLGLNITTNNVKASSTVSRSSITKLAKSLNGSAYAYGGKGPTTFDCSGYVYYVYHKKGVINNYQTSETYYYNPSSVGKKVSASNAKAGDIVAWPDHVAIYLGNDRCIHAMNPTDGVRITSVSGIRDGNGNSTHIYIHVNGVDSSTTKITKPKGTSLKSVSSTKKTLTARWVAQTKKMSGYQIRISRYSDMSNSIKFDVSKKKTYLKITSLRRKTKYYVQVRTYKQKNGDRAYSKWSKKMSIKTK